MPKKKQVHWGKFFSFLGGAALTGAVTPYAVAVQQATTGAPVHVSWEASAAGAIAGAATAAISLLTNGYKKDDEQSQAARSGR